MNMTTAVKTVFSKFYTFTGRASRPEFWWYYLFIIILYIIAALILSLIHISEPTRQPATSRMPSSA